jgi:chemotaxis response regulator CheB
MELFDAPSTPSGAYTANDLPDKSREIADVTRRLSAMALDLAKEGRGAIRATRQKIERSREIVDGSDLEPVTRAWNGETSGQPASSGDQSPNTSEFPPDIIVIGGSAGSLVPLCRILGRLFGDLQAAVFIVQHSSPTGWKAADSAETLQSYTAVPIHVAVEQAAFPCGTNLRLPPESAPRPRKRAHAY